MEKAVEQLPAARKEQLIIRELPDEVLVYDQERNKALCLNQTAALVWKHCDGRTPIASMAQLIEKELKTPVTNDLVWLALTRLDKLNLLQEKIELPRAIAGMSRRDFSRKVGLSAALAIPVIMALSTSASAATCLPDGSSCTSSAQCCSSICSTANSTTGTCGFAQ